MIYDIVITERADKMIDRLLYYLLHKLCNPPAALKFINNLENIYNRMRESPLQFPRCRDELLKSKGYRQALFSNMNYRVIFRVEENIVYILGIFHTLEDYERKIN